MGGLVDWSRMVKKLRIRQTEQIVFGDLPADRFLAAVRRLGDTFTLAIEEIEIESYSFRAFQVGHRFAAALLQLLQTAQVVSLAAESVAPCALSSRPNSPSPPSDCPSQKPFKDLPKSPGSTASNPPENVVSCQAKRTGPHLPLHRCRSSASDPRLTPRARRRCHLGLVPFSAQKTRTRCAGYRWVRG